MTDNYEFMRSSQSQSADKYSPYVRKDWNYVNDINSGVYTNTGQSLVQFDLSSIFNSSRLVDTNDMFLTFPVLINAVCTAGGDPLAPGNLAVAVLAQLKSGFHNLIHQADLQINGKTVEQTQPFINKFVDFKLLSEMSDNDLRSLGPSLGYSDELDNPFSVRWQNQVSSAPPTASCNGNGITNNRPFANASSFGTTPPVFVPVSGSKYQTTAGTSQYTNCVNTALSQRAGSIVDSRLTTPSLTGSNLIGTSTTLEDFIMFPTHAQEEFKPIFSVQSNIMTIRDVAVIRLRDLFDSMANVGLTKRFDGVLRLYVNTGSIVVNVANPNLDTLGYSSSLSLSTFSNTCPVVVNYLPFTNANGGLPATTSLVGVSVNLAKSASFRVGAQTISPNAQHDMNACRCYYSSIELKPQLALKYIEENRNKKVVYRSVITNQTTTITKGANYNQLIQSGITHPTGLVIMPFVDGTLANTGGFGPSGSPFDTNLAHPISLTNLQVQVGGVNVLSNPLFYTYENFLEQVHLFESLTSSDIGISCGLISKQFWEVNRTYFVNLGRGTTSDNLTPRNVQVSFKNNSNLPINCLMFVVYLDEFEIDVETGLVKK